ncbi:MAG: sulfatase-like hydrolase/transferase [Porticoccaceae bacterium]|nr:sulfatase-like hydrolase/transferase [Porticoccaceae bacterium]
MATYNSKVSTNFRKQITIFYFLCFIVIAAAEALHIDVISYTSKFQLFYSLLILVSYSAMYLFPAILLSIVSSLLLPGRMTTAAISILAAAATTALVYSDLILYRLYGFHINMFVWNIVSTKGGMESLGFDQVSTVSFGVVTLAVIFGFVFLWMISTRLPTRILPKLKYLFILFVLITVSERSIYAVNHFFSNGSILSITDQWPLYKPAKASSLMELFGYQRNEHKLVSFHPSGPGSIKYPLAPLDIQVTDKSPNIIMLVVESLRADMLTPEIMPNLWAFSSRNVRFSKHRSGGNGTRQGMFSLFYGLYGNNWDRFLGEHISPTLFTLLEHKGYERLAVTSASFTYPEFDQTIFSTFATNELVEDNKGASWERDERNVDLLITSLKTSPSRSSPLTSSPSPNTERKPQFRFMFFESTHARYNFPETAVIREDYLKEVDYLKFGPDYLTDNMAAFKNRYINAAHHVDTQIGRLIDLLETEGQLENTIVMITGDHGEEFMEHGRWGHNSSFSEEQISVPLVMAVPGVNPVVIDYPSSHLDFTSTILPLLGVKNPVEQYSLGGNLFVGDEQRQIVVSSWSDIGIITNKAKIVVPFRITTQHANLITSLLDKPLPSAQLVGYMPVIRGIMKDANSFLR